MVTEISHFCRCAEMIFPISLLSFVVHYGMLDDTLAVWRRLQFLGVVSLIRLVLYRFAHCWYIKHLGGGGAVVCAAMIAVGGAF